MGEVKRFVPRKQRIRAETAADVTEQLQLILDDLPEQPREAILNALHRFIHDDLAEGIWSGGFDMISRVQTIAIWDAIRTLPSDKRPKQVRHAFDLTLVNLRQDTGEIMLTRDQFAEKIGCAANHVSRIMGTLEEMGVIRRERRKLEGVQGPGMAVYFINPHVAWNGKLEIRKRKADKCSAPLLRVLDGGASD